MISCIVSGIPATNTKKTVQVILRNRKLGITLKITQDRWIPILFKLRFKNKMVLFCSINQISQISLHEKTNCISSTTEPLE